MKGKFTKTRVLSVLLVSVMLLLLCACGGSADKYGSSGGSTNTGYSMAQTNEMAYPTEAAYDSAVSYEEADMETGDSLLATGVTSQEQFADKIIYSANAEVETLHFDDAVDAVYAMVEQYRGFMESSYVSGNNYANSYYGQQSYRRASFTIRVPAGSFSAVKGDLDQLGYVTSLETYSDNITTQFYDTKSRLDAYNVEAQRLIEMLEKAESVEDMIYIESRLSDVQYNIDSLTSRLKNWQQSVDYSTLNLTLREVAEIKVTPSVTESYWQKMGKGFVSTLNAIGSFFKDLFLWLVTALPALVLLALIGLVIYLIIRRKLKKRKPAAPGTTQIPQNPNQGPWQK